MKVPYANNKRRIRFYKMKSSPALPEARRDYHKYLENIVDKRTEELKKINQELQREIAERKRIEEALRFSEDKFYKAFCSSPDLITISSFPDCCFINVNESFLTATGYTRPEVLGHTPEDLDLLAMPGKTPPETFSQILMEQPNIRNQETSFFTRSGETKTGLLSVEKIEIEGNTHILTVIKDITERKHVEITVKESERRLNDIINFLPDATLVIDREGKVITWNRAAEEMTGIKSEYMIGKGNYEYALPFYGTRRPILIDLVLNPSQEWEKYYPEVERKGETQLSGESFCPAVGKSGAYLRATAAPIYDPLGNKIGAIESIRDATERKEIEELILAQRDLGLSLANATSPYEILSHCLDALLRVSEVNSGSVYLKDKKAGKLIMIHSRDLSPNFVGKVLNFQEGTEIYNFFISNHIKYTSAEELQPYLGSVFLQEGLKAITVIPVFYQSSLEACFIISSHNLGQIPPEKRRAIETITSWIESAIARIKIEQALRDSEERFRTIYEKSPIGIQFYNAEGKLVHINQASQDVLGIVDIDQIKGFNLFKDPHIPLFYKKLLKQNKSVQFEYELNFETVKKNKLFPTEKTGAVYLNTLITPIKPEGENEVLSGYMVQVQDFTERKRAEMAIKDSEQRLNDIINFLPDATLAIDREGKVITWNRAMEEMTGVKAKDIIGKGNYEYSLPFYGKRQPILIDLVFKSDPEIEKDYFFIQRDREALVAETPTPCVKGKEAFMWAKATPLYNTQGEIIGAIESIRDITARKENEEALRLSEERFSKAFNCSPVSMAITSFKTGKYISVNDGFCRITGYNAQEVLGKTAKALNIWAHSEDFSKAKKIFLREGSLHNLEIQFHKKSGDIGTGLFSAEHIDIDGETCILSILTDITEHKQMEKEMLRLSQLNLIGEMAASIGHEVRNPMTTVRGFLQLLDKNEKYEPEREFFNLMIEELDRANSIITEFLSLARNKRIEREMYNLNHIITALFPLLQSSAIAQDKKVVINLDEQLPDLLLDEKEIRQLILNLAHNGLEAMGSNKHLTIKTFRDHDHIVLAVIDQGKGMKKEILENLGTPFITTKDNGTGLGLAVCCGISARHDANIHVETGPSGTTFMVRFPGTP